LAGKKKDKEAEIAAFDTNIDAAKKAVDDYIKANSDDSGDAALNALKATLEGKKTAKSDNLAAAQDELAKFTKDLGGNQEKKKQADQLKFNRAARDAGAKLLDLENDLGKIKADKI